MNDQNHQNEAACGVLVLPAELEFCWRAEIGHWADGHVCYVGKWPIGKVAWAGRKKGAAEQEAAYIKLPGLEECLGFYATEEEARAQVEKSARYWFESLITPPLSLVGA